MDQYVIYTLESCAFKSFWTAEPIQPAPCTFLGRIFQKWPASSFFLMWEVTGPRSPGGFVAKEGLDLLVSNLML